MRVASSLISYHLCDGCAPIIITREYEEHLRPGEAAERLEDVVAVEVASVADTRHRDHLNRATARRMSFEWERNVDRPAAERAS